MVWVSLDLRSKLLCTGCALSGFISSQCCCEDECDDVVDVSCSIDWDAGPTLYWNAAYATLGEIRNDGSTFDISSFLTGGASDSGSRSVLNFNEDVVVEVSGPCGTASTTCYTCDDMICTLQLVSTYDPDKVKLIWNVESVQGNYPIDSVIINGVEQLGVGEQVYVKSGEIEWDRGSDVPASISITVTNTCNNQCTNSITPSCCMRNTVSYLEFTGFNNSYSHTCTFPSGAYNTSTVTGLDGLNGVWSQPAADSDPFTSCWEWPLPIEASGVEVYTEVFSPGNPPFVPSEWRWTRYTGKAYISTGFHYLQFQASSVAFYWEVGGNIISQGSGVSTWLYTLSGSFDTLLPSIECDTPGAYGTPPLIFPPAAIPNQCDVSGGSYNPPPVCSGQSAVTPAFSCYHLGGTIRGWLSN